MTQVSQHIEDPATDAAQLLLKVGIAMLAIALPCIAIFSRQFIFSLMPIGAVLILLSIALIPQRHMHPSWRQTLMQPIPLVFGLLIIWAALSLLWTPDFSTGLERFTKTISTVGLAGLVIAFLPARTKIPDLYLLPLGVALAAILLLFSASPLADLTFTQEMGETVLDRAALCLIMLLWPALAALAKRERWASLGALSIGVASGVISAWAPLPLLGVALGALTYVCANNRPELTARVLGILSAGLFVFMPALIIMAGFIASHLGLSSTNIGAITIAWGQIISGEGFRLITGHGIDTMGYSFSIGLLPSYIPHSIFFEIWYEFGLVGALSCAALAWYAFDYALHTSKIIVPFYMAALTCGLVIAASGMLTTQHWWLTLLAVVGVNFSLVINSATRKARPLLHRKFVGSEP